MSDADEVGPGGSFPEGFRWGAATASYQIEGAVHEGGRGESIWDRFSHTPGRTLNGDTGDVACDHYHRYPEDVAILAELGVDTYRFSIAWPRLQPDGRGRLVTEGVAFYERLIESLLAADVRPWVTLYHWDLPQALEDRGGWPARDTALRFAEYAVLVHERLGDRVTDWTTLNEPLCSAFLGYAAGHHAPGVADPTSAVRAVHHLLLGHGLAVAAMREDRSDHRYGITLNVIPTNGASDDPADADAARRVDGVFNRIFLDPLFGRDYPDDVLAEIEPYVDGGLIEPDDLATIAAPLDFLGINYYSRLVVRPRRDAAADPDVVVPLGLVGVTDVEQVSTGRRRTQMGWEIDPSGFYDLLRRVHDEYGPVPLYVTENGAAFADEVTADGVHDVERTRYLGSHLRAARQAIVDGVDLRGYFVWSLLDNFEWAFGYDRRFGVVHVDFQTQQRTIKDSGRWYAEVVRANAVPEG